MNRDDPYYSADGTPFPEHELPAPVPGGPGDGPGYVAPPIPALPGETVCGHFDEVFALTCERRKYHTNSNHGRTVGTVTYFWPTTKQQERA